MASDAGLTTPSVMVEPLTTTLSPFELLDFGVELSPAVFEGLDDPSTRNRLPVDLGMVGTLTVTPKAVHIWLGWGRIVAGGADQVTEARTNLGESLSRTMGPLVVAMPRTRYQGHEEQAASSKLIGDENEDTEMIVRQMASRLSRRFQRAVFCAGHLDGGPVVEGSDPGMLVHRAAAEAEREITRVLEKHLGS